MSSDQRAGFFARAQQRVRRFAAASPVFSHIMTLVSGTVLAQMVAVLLNIPLARIYTDYDYGLFTLFTSVVAVGYAVAGLRYDLAIMLPKADVEALVVARLARRLIVAMSLLFSAVCIVLSRVISVHYQSQVLANWMMACGVAIFVMAEVQNIQYWLNRKSDYKGIAANRFVQTVAVSAFQLVMALFVSGVSGLVLGTIFGHLLALILMRRRAGDLFVKVPEGAPSLRAVAWRYRKMPLLNGSNILVDAWRTNGINFLLANLSVGGLGQYNMASRMMMVPVGLIQGAISQVFFQKMAQVKRGELYPLVAYTLKRLAVGSLVAFAVIYVLAPWAFTFVFGEQWQPAGELARALTPWMFMMTLSSPVANLFIVTESQQSLLVFAIVYCVVPLGLLFFGDWDLLTTVRLLAAVMAVLLVCQVGLALFTARRWDRKTDEAGAGAASGTELGDDTRAEVAGETEGEAEPGNGIDPANPLENQAPAGQ